MSARQDKSLHDACGKGQLKKVREILEKGGDVVTMLESRVGFLGYTPLHEAACQGHDDILRLLLIYGGNVDAKANGNYTPLHIAASMDYVKCIKVCCFIVCKESFLICSFAVDYNTFIFLFETRFC